MSTPTAGMTTAITTITDLSVSPGDSQSPLPPASLLQLIWLASPALPVGGFS